MKTSTTLTILAGTNPAWLGCHVFCFLHGRNGACDNFPGDANLLHLATNMHVGIGHAFFMIGILLLAARKAELAVAKTILIAYLIGIAAMFAVMYLVMAKSELMNFSIEMIAPDMLFFAFAIFGYFKAK